MRRPVVLALALTAAAAAALAPGERATAAVGPVLVVGDSLAVGTTPPLRGQLHGARVESNGRIGRPSGEAVSVLRSLFSGQRVVVFDAGVNDDPANPGRLAGDLATVRDIVGGRCLVIATVSRPPYNRVALGGGEPPDPPPP